MDLEMVLHFCNPHSKSYDTIFQNTFLEKQYNPFEQNHPPK